MGCGAPRTRWTTYQGLVPATLPYFVLDHRYSYVAASGLTLAAALGSSVPQPFVGVLVDRYRLGWMAAAGVALAGAGLGLSGWRGRTRWSGS